MSDSTGAAVAPLVDYVRSIVALSHVDQQRAVATLCSTWQAEKGDNQTINDYVLDLFSGGQVGPAGPVPAPDEISRAVVAACASSKSDAEKFVRAVAADLHLSADELKGKVVAACARYRTRLARDKASGYQGNADLDPFIRGIAGQAGANGAALRAAVDAICPA